MSHVSPTSSDTSPSFIRGWGELAGLWALAIAWPVYQRVGSGPEALTGLGIRSLDLIVFVLVLSVLVPLVLVIPERVAGLISSRAAALTHAILVGLLAGLIVWAALEPGILCWLLGGITFALAGWLRLGTEFGRRFAAILAIATPVTIVLFFTSYPVSAALLPGKSPAPVGQTDSKTPVVLVVLDELPLAALLDRDQNVDARLFPNFARLQREGTWYRQATSLTDHTLAALPSILTGEDPRAETTFGEPTPPGYPAYPDSVCSVTERAGYEGWSSQFVTDLCARHLDMPTRLSRLLLQAIPTKLPGEISDLIGREIKTDEMTPGRAFERGVTALADAFGRPREIWGDERGETFEDFIDQMPARPGTISFIHSALPHSEYQFLPDGTPYTSRWLFDGQTYLNLASPVNANESAKNLQQLTAQTMYVDHLLGRLIARLERKGIWDRTLFAVVADHGASFAPGTTRRNLTAASSGWLLPIPLFVKYPGESRGKVTDTAADIRDVTPTILDALGLDPSPRATGKSLREGPLPKASVIHAVNSYGTPLDLSRRTVARKRAQAIRFRNRHLGSGLYALGGNRELIGKPASQLDARPIEYDVQTHLGFDPESFDSVTRPAYFQANLPGVKADPGPLAIAVDGRVVATARAWLRDGTWMTGTNLPIPAGVKHLPKVSVYRIDDVSVAA